MCRFNEREQPAMARALTDALSGEGMRPVSGGTDTHLALIDLRGDPGSPTGADSGDEGVTGRDAEQRCDLARITLNKNAIPYDPRKPAVASGIRFGTGTTTVVAEQSVFHDAARPSHVVLPVDLGLLPADISRIFCFQSNLLGGQRRDLQGGETRTQREQVGPGDLLPTENLFERSSVVIL